MTPKKYTISLDGLPGHESVIFKLICSVSERTKNRNMAYALSSDSTNADIHINDIKNKTRDDTSSPLKVWISDITDDSDNAITRPLIATRVLHTLDQLITNNEPLTSNNESSTTTDSSEAEKAVSNTSNYNISEEEASELAIVHDDILENPANKEESAETNSNVELTLVKNEKANTPVMKTGTPHVLVVDDSPSVRKQLEIELDLFDVTVDYADCAEAAFNLLSQNKYDMALLDVVLPDKDGFQICKKIKTDSKDTIAIMLTGKATQADKIKGSLAGCDDYLIKPVGRMTFQNAVKNYIPAKTESAAIHA